MTLDKFITNMDGQSVLFNTATPDLRGQCVQLVCFYCRDVLGIPNMWENAANWWYKFSLDGYLVKVPYPNNYPRRGDIVIFGKNTPGSDGAGHIDICTQDGDEHGFIGFDSNWSGKIAHQVHHDYVYVIGFLRPGGKGEEDMALTTDDDTRVLYNVFLGHEPDAAALGAFRGKDLHETIFKIAAFQEHVDYQNQINSFKGRIAELEGQEGGAILNREAALKYVQDNLK